MKPTAKKTAWAAGLFFLLIAGVAVVCGIERNREVSVPILMFHSISSDLASKWVEPVENFRKTIEALHDEGYHSILPSDLVAHCRWGKRLPDRPVILTFDDGLLDCVEKAEPILREFGFKAICYLITGYVAETPEERIIYEKRPCLTWDEVRAAMKRGTLVFGGHTRTHPNLILAGPGQIQDCYNDIVEKTGVKPDSFAYPFGMVEPGLFEHVRRAGFSSAVTTIDAVAHPRDSSQLLELPRISMMGGHYEFVTELATNTPGQGTLTVNFRVVDNWNTNLALWPRLSWPSAGKEDGWMTAGASKVDKPMTFTGRYPANTDANVLLFEMWDDRKLLPVYDIRVGQMTQATQQMSKVQSPTSKVVK